jgi:hypothetical protein
MASRLVTDGVFGTVVHALRVSRLVRPPHTFFIAVFAVCKGVEKNSCQCRLVVVVPLLRGCCCFPGMSVASSDEENTTTRRDEDGYFSYADAVNSSEYCVHDG